MDDSRLDQLIIDMAHTGVSRAGIIRALITQGYDAEHIQERVNELYYAGALAPDRSDELRRAGVRELDASISDEEKNTVRIPTLSRFQHFVLWIRLHPVKTVVWMLVVLIFVGSGVGGYIGYARSPVRVMTRMADTLHALSSIAFTITKNTHEISPKSYTIQGIMDARGQESLSVLFADSDTETPWRMHIVRGTDGIVYVRLISGPVSYPFLYDRWISFNNQTEGVDIRSDLGLADLYDFLAVPELVWSNFSLSDAYQSILVQPRTDSCRTLYSVLFAPSVDTNTFLSGELAIYVRTLFTNALWEICVSPTQGILSVSSNDFSMHIFLPATIPSFTIDTPATSIETIGKWIEEGKVQ